MDERGLLDWLRGWVGLCEMDCGAAITIVPRRQARCTDACSSSFVSTLIVHHHASSSSIITYHYLNISKTHNKGPLAPFFDSLHSHTGCLRLGPNGFLAAFDRQSAIQSGTPSHSTMTKANRYPRACNSITAHSLNSGKKLLKMHGWSMKVSSFNYSI